MAPRKASRSATPIPSTPISTSAVTPSVPAATSSISKSNPFLNKSSSSTSTSNKNNKEVSFASTINSLWSSYLTQTNSSLKMLDTLQLFLMLTGITQFLYCIIVTNYPFNAFLGGFSATVGQFVLTASMRSQVNPENKDVFSTITPERALGDFVFGSMILHFFVFSYLG